MWSLGLNKFAEAKYPINCQWWSVLVVQIRSDQNQNATKKISLDFWFHQLQQKERLIISISGVLGGVTDSPDRPRREDEDAEQRVDGGRQEMVQALEVRLWAWSSLVVGGDEGVYRPMTNPQKLWRTCKAAPFFIVELFLLFMSFFWRAPCLGTVELFSKRRWTTGLAQQSNNYWIMPCMC